MNGMDVYNSITRLDENLADGYLNGGKRSFRKRLIVKIIANVLFVAVLITVITVIYNKYASRFALYAYDENGESVRLILETTVNTVPADRDADAFGGKHPCFSITVCPVSGNGKEMKEKYDVSVQYRSREVKSGSTKDSNIMITFSAERKTGYVITGWTDEIPMDITIVITDKETGKHADQFYLNIKYSESKGAYEISVRRRSYLR
ncbi:MAG: hypothetical protein IJL41_01015 [Clostridia bacterium]|nr:hypothetical protein [Clostridia bacterium]